ncbi:MAG TPA: hypothetical protein PK867_16370, partial [Pirellulales bacterium]|nr:hypothetical protein [Pirellulales bacterium]
ETKGPIQLAWMVNKIIAGYPRGPLSYRISFTIRASRMGSRRRQQPARQPTICFTIEASSMGSWQ